MNKSSAGVYRHDTLALPPIIGQQRTCGQEESRVPDIQQSVEMSFYREHWITYEYAHRTHYIFVPETWDFLPKAKRVFLRSLVRG
jgi:hypothetical protein